MYALNDPYKQFEKSRIILYNISQTLIAYWRTESFAYKNSHLGDPTPLFTMEIIAKTFVDITETEPVFIFLL